MLIKHSAQQRKIEIIEEVLGLLHERLAEDEAQRAERFARRYYQACAADELLATPVDDLYGAVLSHYHFCQQRQPGELLLRIYNPAYEEHGWQSTHTVIEIVTDDMPFLVDSISMELARCGAAVHSIIHPVIRLARSATGELEAILERGEEHPHKHAEAVLHFEIDRQTEPHAVAELQQNLARVIGDVRLVVEDWQAMQDKLLAVIDDLSRRKPPVEDDVIEEVVEFLHWLKNHHFTFIGFRAYDLVQQDGETELHLVPGSGLGIFRGSKLDHVSRSFAQMPAELRAKARESRLLILTKSTAVSTVHRPAHLDYVGIKRYDAAGEVIGEWRFLGLYTSLAYSIRPIEIPILRRKVAHVLKSAMLEPTSHRGKALQHIMDNFPRDEMFQASGDELLEIATGILDVQDRHRLSLFLRNDMFSRFVSALVLVPRDRYDTELRQRLQQILLEAFEAEDSEFDVQFFGALLARVHFVVHLRPGHVPQYDVAELEERMARAMVSWDDQLHHELVEHYGEEPGNRLFRRYQEAFPIAYQEDFPPRSAVLDISRLEGITEQQPLALYLYRPLEEQESLLRFKVIGCGAPLALSDVLPMLEHMGLRVLEARPYDIEPRAARPSWILDFELTAGRGVEVDVLQVREIFEDAFTQVCRGAMENDGFNRLVLAGCLPWRDVVVLRAIAKYLLQTRAPFSQAYMEQSLAENAPIARLLVQLFHSRFDPRRAAGEAEHAMLAAQIEKALEGVPSLDEDRILRQFLAMMQAMLRTNYFQKTAAGTAKDYLSFKLDPHKVPELPLPRPMFEIFVYSPRVEGVHLRGGRVARGGLRWSDRREDFRTEVLGLMKAQMVKNAVIVPVGAKGGFVAKQLPKGGGSKEIQAEVIACYQTFIRALLDLTDNRSNGQVVPPPDVLRYDEDDSYLVVAADKGTAAFSDIANAIAAEYGFWLGDAFASGGSAGYDHKKMGITARGAWESVKGHFRELGRDIQHEPFTVAGIGSMSGDVFGNGMLLSPQIRLIAAFSHAHIFLDPDPDPAVSFAERARLFEARSSWEQYDTGLISPGGGVYPRSAKIIALSEQARRALGIEATHLRPSELVQAILRAPVDLLWNGAIGTYVKASAEPQTAAHDRANDAVRINADELRCRAVGEGGNLGFTQLARIEFAQRGGLIITDFIDNSGGVDCSDHEVNIKILLGQIVRNGDMTEKQRNALLVQMTDEVAQLVLRHNYLQSQALAISAYKATYLLADHARLIRRLEQDGLLKRRLEFLPPDEEIAEREAAHGGLTRPEAAVLQAYSKIQFFGELLESDIADDPYLGRELRDYFPAPIRERFGERLDAHPLRRQIIATQITNDMINRTGCTFAVRMREQTGAQAADIARAYTAAREIFEIPQIWQQIEALDNAAPTLLQLDMQVETRRLLSRATLWLLRNRCSPIDVAGTIERYQANAHRIVGRLHRLLKHDGHDALKQRIRLFSTKAVPKALARRVAGLDPCYSVLDLTEVALSAAIDVLPAAEAYFALGVTLDLPWLHARLRELPEGTHWQRQARASLLDDLFSDLAALTRQLLQDTAGMHSTEARIEAWIALNRTGIEHYTRLYSDLKASATPDISMLAVACKELRNLARSRPPVVCPIN